jgi:hypothetical protein
MTRTETIARAIARFPHTGPLHADLLAESDVVVTKLRPLLNGHRLGAIVRALFILTVEFAGMLLKLEASGCDCVADRKNGLYKCTTRREHALTTLVTKTLKIILLAAILTHVAGCGSFQSPTIALDTVRDANDFNIVCGFRDAAVKFSPTSMSPCVRGASNDVERAFQVEFLANSACSGIQLANLPDLKPYPAKTSVLSFNSEIADDGTVSVKNSAWRLIGGSGVLSGAVGDMHDTVTNVCRVVKGQGGSVR